MAMTKFLRSAKIWTLGMTLMAAAVPAAQQAAAPAAAPTPGGQQRAPLERYVVGQARPEAPAGSQLIELTLQQAVDLALEKNLDLKAQKLAPQLVDYQLQSARAAFNPRFTGSYGYNNRSQPVNSTVLDPTL